MLTRRAPEAAVDVTTTHRRDDQGFSLAEVLVSMGIMTVVGAMSLAFFVWASHTTTANAERSFDNQDARRSLTTVAGMLRLAAPGTIAATQGGSVLSPTTVTFTANDGALAAPAGTACLLPPSVVTYALSNGALVQTRTGAVSTPVAGNPCAYTSATVKRTLATGLRSLTFTYASSARDANGVLLPATTPGTVAAVTVTITVGGDTPGTVLQTYTATSTVSGGAS